MVAVTGAGADAVLGAAEVQRHPWGVDEQREELVCCGAARPVAAGRLTAAANAEKGGGELVGQPRGLPDRLVGVGDDRQRDQAVDEAHGQRAGGLGVAALHERVPHRPARPPTPTATTIHGCPNVLRIEPVDRVGDRRQGAGAAGRVGAVEQVKREREGEEGDQRVGSEGGDLPGHVGQEEGDHRRHAGGVDAAGQAGLDRAEVLIERVVAQRVAIGEPAHRVRPGRRCHTGRSTPSPTGAPRRRQRPPAARTTRGTRPSVMPRRPRGWGGVERVQERRGRRGRSGPRRRGRGGRASGSGPARASRSRANPAHGVGSTPMSSSARVASASESWPNMNQVPTRSESPSTSSRRWVTSSTVAL